MDVPDMTTLLALQRKGIQVADSQPVMLEARKIKSPDELALLDQAAGIVDAAYETIYRMLRPGVRESEVVAAAMQVLFELGSEHVEAINAIRGDRCNPHPHTFSDRLLRPGDQAFFDIIHSFMGYRTCYYRTFSVGCATPAQLDAYKQCREWLDNAIAQVRPGMTTDKIAEVWPTAQQIGMQDEHAAFGLQFGHGLGVGLYEAPMISQRSTASSIPSRSRTAWSSPSRPTAPPATAKTPPASRKKSSSPRRAPHDHPLPRRGTPRHRPDLHPRRRLHQRRARLAGTVAAPPAATSRTANDDLAKV